MLSQIVPVCLFPFFCSSNLVLKTTNHDTASTIAGSSFLSFDASRAAVPDAFGRPVPAVSAPRQRQERAGPLRTHRGLSPHAFGRRSDSIAPACKNSKWNRLDSLKCANGESDLICGSKYAKFFKKADIVIACQN
jgi:hypothetical protein